MTDEPFARGRCSCGAVTFRMMRAPMVVHCCHCRQCQRETGAGFALNALIEESALEAEGALAGAARPTASGSGVAVSHCAACASPLFMRFHAGGPGLVWVRVGALEDPELCPPSVHIFTDTRLPWVTIPPDVPSYPAFYPPGTVWSDEGRARRKAAVAAASFS